MFCHIGLHATTSETSAYTICHGYWKMYHWQSEHESGTCMMVVCQILAVLCEMFSVTPVMTYGQVQKIPLHDLSAHQT
jgi:thiol:disulfide interchange protein